MKGDPNCQTCGGSGVEEVYGGHGTVLEVPCRAIPDAVLDAMADAVWEKIGTMSMEDVRGMLETAISAAAAESYELRKIETVK